MLILFPEQGHEIAGIRDGVHYSRENPLRDETSRGPPLITPANSSSGFFSSREKELSTAWRLPGRRAAPCGATFTEPIN